MNVFKRYLSYLWDIRVEERSSDYNPELILFLSKGRYQLCTSDAIYSHEDKYYNFRKILWDYIDYETLNGKRLLVLGLGMASIPLLVDQLHPGQWAILGVEIDEEIIDLASLYTIPKIKSNIQTIATDAKTFVRITQNKFDLICVDIFIGQHTPDEFQTSDFLRLVKERLDTQGIVIYNTIAFTKKDLKKAESFFELTFRSVFPEGRAIKAHRNLMLLNR